MKKITLNKDDDMSNVFPLQYHLLNKFVCVKFTHAFLFCSLP